MHSFIHSIKEAYYNAQVQYVLRYHVHPCTADDILFLENTLQLTLPLAYKNFLRRAGRQPNDFFGEDMVGFATLLQCIEDAKDLLRENHLPLSAFPTDGIVVWFAEQGYSFAFIRTTEGDDPPVWLYVESEGTDEIPFAKVSQSFWKFVYQRQVSHLRTEATTTNVLHPEVLTSGSFDLDAVKLAESLVRMRAEQRAVPASNIEILDLEKRLNASLSKTYRDFLQWCGNGIPNLWRQQSWTLSSLNMVRPFIDKKYGQAVPDTAHIFLVYSGNEEFDMFHLFDGDDPPIYHFRATGEDIRISLSPYTFSDYVREAIRVIR